MKALPEKLAEQYADDKSKTYYIGENGEKKWYITPRGQYAKEDFLAGYRAAQEQYREAVEVLDKHKAAAEKAVTNIKNASDWVTIEKAKANENT